MTLAIWCFVDTFFIGQTIKYISACSVQLCNNAVSSSGGSGNNCSSIPTCYKLQTSTNVSVCAPQVACHLFDPCINETRCASNLTRCIINSCCAVTHLSANSIDCCLWSASCHKYRYWHTFKKCKAFISSFEVPSPQGRICPNATWNPSYTSLF